LRLERGALSACWPRTTAWMNAIVSNPLVREWLDEADRLPHIWFDDYLPPDAPPALKKSATGAAVDAPPARPGV
jgi:hypothetical protein